MSPPFQCPRIVKHHLQVWTRERSTSLRFLMTTSSTTRTSRGSSSITKTRISLLLIIFIFSINCSRKVSVQLRCTSDWRVPDESLTFFKTFPNSENMQIFSEKAKTLFKTVKLFSVFRWDIEFILLSFILRIICNNKAIVLRQYNLGHLTHETIVLIICNTALSFINKVIGYCCNVTREIILQIYSWQM